MLIVGIGGTQRPGSSSETALKIAAAAAAGRGADTLIFSAGALEPPLQPGRCGSHAHGAKTHRRRQGRRRNQAVEPSAAGYAVGRT
jgi:FMN reductase